MKNEKAAIRALIAKNKAVFGNNKKTARRLAREELALNKLELKIFGHKFFALN